MSIIVTITSPASAETTKLTFTDKPGRLRLPRAWRQGAHVAVGIVLRPATTWTAGIAGIHEEGLL